ncbi:uncharacterized protein EAE97_003141 [Botrytis byssoidea]|uniref:Zn(2)-C6 fungal-type domain-containing protein n=1 Tax=Botrytis byssoidea TaxID=139641 RepID=A0A9P5IUW5_9HELO|nr:uncharacterized protein EAE97_003141 [Botrytis byssoidea]KAF7949632.1 hypothetical protein EAE97_003141 [Botrytis byssoidea]
MPRVAPGQRKRAYRPKTKTGCATFRRVKCDEGRPSCQRCVSTGRKCDGYAEESSDSPASSNSDYNDYETSTALIQSPSSSVILTSDREREAFHFFVNMTAPMMGGFGKESCWSEMIPQAAHHEPSIRHAVIALGALHHSKERSSRSTSSNKLFSSAEEQFPLLEYNRAIKCLVEPFAKKERQAMGVSLINCVLFSAFEMMQGNYGHGAAHQESGSKILCEITYDENSQRYYHDSLETSSYPYLPMSLLEELYLRSDFVLTQMIDIFDQSLYNKFKSSHFTAHPPAIFTSLSQARNSLHFFWSRFRIDLYKLNCQPDSPELNQRAAILQIQSHCGYMNAHVPRGVKDNQMLWDPFLSVFEKIIVLSEEVISNPAFATTVFQIDMGIIGPLYQVVSVCRHPIVRRKAIALLERVPSLQEGIWNAGMTARVGRRVIELEEYGIEDVREAADIPDWARVSDVEPQFEKDGRRVTLTYNRSDSAGGPLVRNKITEIFEW